MSGYLQTWPVILNQRYARLRLLLSPKLLLTIQEIPSPKLHSIMHFRILA